LSSIYAFPLRLRLGAYKLAGMAIVLFNNLTNKDKSEAIKHLIKASTPRQDFFFMTVLAVLTATFGLLLNNSAVIIGSMLIAPILYPILSLSLGITMSDSKLIYRSSYTLVKSSILGVLSAAAATLLFTGRFTEITPEILLRTYTSLPYVVIAIIAGLAGSFALVKPQLNETIPGIAISVALIPPLAVVGIGIAKFSWTIVSGSLLLYLVNVTGIVFASMLVFSLMDLYRKRGEADRTADEEDNIVLKQEKK
jgi:uncharacterized hydrophobic protein (TIGR00271 family)